MTMKQTKEQFIGITYEELLAENAKLRELCADLYEMAYYEYPSAFETAFAGRMRELGIEVSNGQED